MTEDELDPAAEPADTARKPTRAEARRLRVAQGLCVDCGRPRQGSTEDEIRALRLAELLHGRAPYPLPHRPTATRCSACAGSHQRGDEARRARWYASHDTPRGAPRPADAPRVNVVMTLRVPLNQVTLSAINDLKRWKREADAAAGRPYVPGQLSHMIREIIRQWRSRDGGGPFPLGAAHFSLRGVNLHFGIDAETLAILDRVAAHSFHGSRSATVRAMILAAAEQPAHAPALADQAWPD